jgi:hypothetical protein
MVVFPVGSARNAGVLPKLHQGVDSLEVSKTDADIGGVH